MEAWTTGGGLYQPKARVPPGWSETLHAISGANIVLNEAGGNVCDATSTATTAVARSQPKPLPDRA